MYNGLNGQKSWGQCGDEFERNTTATYLQQFKEIYILCMQFVQ